MTPGRLSGVEQVERHGVAGHGASGGQSAGFHRTIQVVEEPCSRNERMMKRETLCNCNTAGFSMRGASRVFRL